MPNSLSAKKRLRQDAVRRERNRAIKSVVRKRIRTVREAVAAGELEKAEQTRQTIYHLGCHGDPPASSTMM